MDRALELVIFDCDGVLVDSEVISNEALASALSDHGLETTLAQSRREYQGMLLAEIVARAEAKLGRPLPDDWLSNYERDRDERFRRDLKAVAGARAALESVRRAGVKLCVASQSKPAKIALALGLTGLESLIPESARFSSYSVARGKPHPDVFLHAAATIGVVPARCVVVEDSPSGVTAAVRAGMRVIGYTADSDADALRAAGAAERIDTLDALPRLLGLN